MDKVGDAVGDAVAEVAAEVLEEMNRAKQSADALQQDVAFIKEELEMMESFLMDVAGERGQSQVVKTWVRQVRDLAYDGEDCLQEFSLHLEKPPRASSKLLLPRDMIATRMKDLRSKVERVNKRCERYRTAGFGLNTAAVQSSISTLPRLNSGAQVPTVAASGNAPLIGREMERSHIIQLISQEGDQPQVISIWGMVGIGKTTLTKSVYESQELSSMFKQRAWVTVLHPFNLDDFLTSFAQQLDADNVLGHGTKTNLEALGIRGPKSEESIKPLSGRRSLIVLDNVLSTAEWKLIEPYLPKEINASRIIVTTSEASVAEHCSTAYMNIYKLEALQDDAALELFKNKVFMETSNTDLHPDMTTQAKLILKECDGHPLAIANIGGYLASKPTTAMEWKKLNDHFGAGLGSNASLEMIRTALAPTYGGLPYHLKLCFLYLSIFPKGHSIRRRRLIRRWIAEGYSSKTHTNTMSAEEIGEGYFAELINRSIIRPSKTVTHNVGSIDHCQVHNLLHKISVSKSMEEKHGFLLGCSSDNQDTIRHLAIISTGEDMLEIPDMSHVRSLTVFGKWRSSFISSKMRLLRVLDLEGTSGLKDHDLKQVGNFLHLRYLSVRGCLDIYHLPDSLGDLWDLETLDVRGTDIIKLPKTITKLNKLQYLRAGNVPKDEVTSSSESKESSDFAKKVQTAIDDVELPEALAKTVQLGTTALDLAAAYCQKKDRDDNVKKRDVYNKYCRVLLPGIVGGLDMHGVEAPDGIGKLNALHTLGVVNVVAGKDILAELEKLTQLRKLGVTGINKKNSQRVLSAIANLALLHSLSMRSEGKPGLYGCLEHKFLPPKHLQSLKLYGNLVTLPTWIAQLQNLAKLKLRSTQLEQDPAMQVLGMLPHLAILRLWKESFQGEELVFHFQRETFPSLAVLELAGLDGLKSVRFEQGAVPTLELLQVEDCIPEDNSGFSGLSFLPSLKEVMLKGDYDNKIMEDLRAQLAQNPIRPVLKAA